MEKDLFCLFRQLGIMNQEVIAVEGKIAENTKELIVNTMNSVGRL